MCLVKRIGCTFPTDRLTALRSAHGSRPHQRGVGASEHERPSPERHGGGNGGKHAHERMSEAAAEEEEEEGEAQS